MPQKLISVGRLIDESIELYRAKFSYFLSLSYWMLLIAILFILSLSLYPSASTLWLSNSLTISENIGVLLFIFTNYIVTPLISLWVFIALIRLIKMYFSGRGISINRAHNETKPLYIPMIVVLIMVGFLMILALLISFGPSIILAGLGVLFHSSILVGFGDILLIIGVFVAIVLVFKWMVEYIMSPYATALEGLTGKKALIKSKRLIQGRFWEVVIRLVVPKLVFIIIGILIMGIISYVTTTIISVAGGLNLDLQLRIKTLIEWSFPIVIAMLINPLIVIADVLLYKALSEEE